MCRLLHVVSSQIKANMIHIVKDVAIYKVDKTICLNVPVRVLCYAMEVTTHINCAMCMHKFQTLLRRHVQYCETSIGESLSIQP